jgi:hypothetical protein
MTAAGSAMTVQSPNAGATPARDLLNSGGDDACRLVGTAGYSIRLSGQLATARIRRCLHSHILQTFGGENSFAGEPTVPRTPSRRQFVVSESAARVERHSDIETTAPNPTVVRSNARS